MDEKIVGHVVEFPVDLIKVDDCRYRKDMGDVEALAESIKAIGQMVPIHITEDGTLIAGERRLKATKLLKLPTIKAIVETRKDINNRILEITENLERKDFTWQEQVLAMDDLHAMMKVLHGKNWSERKTATKIGLSNAGVITDLNLAEVLKTDPEIFKGCETKQQALKALQKFKIDETMAEIKLRRSKTNYGRQAANHVWLGNCLDLIDKLPDGIINAVITDPPFGINIDAIKRRTSDRGDMQNVIYEDSIETYKHTMSTLLSKLNRVLSKDAWLSVFCGIQHFPWLIEEFKKINITPDFIPALWTKGGTTGQISRPEVYFSRTYEAFVYGYKGNATLIKQGQSNVLQFSVVHNQDKDHPVQKPISLMEEIISRFCLPGHRILDPFAGSGSTLVAAIKYGCEPFAFEMDEKYFNIAINNVAEALKMKDAGERGLIR